MTMDFSPAHILCNSFLACALCVFCMLHRAPNLKSYVNVTTYPQLYYDTGFLISEILWETFYCRCPLRLVAYAIRWRCEEWQLTVVCVVWLVRGKVSVRTATMFCFVRNRYNKLKKNVFLYLNSDGLFQSNKRCLLYVKCLYSYVYCNDFFIGKALYHFTCSLAEELQYTVVCSCIDDIFLWWWYV